jgi:hypothetical protein
MLRDDSQRAPHGNALRLPVLRPATGLYRMPLEYPPIRPRRASTGACSRRMATQWLGDALAPGSAAVLTDGTCIVQEHIGGE